MVVGLMVGFGFIIDDGRLWKKGGSNGRILSPLRARNKRARSGCEGGAPRPRAAAQAAQEEPSKEALAAKAEK